MCGIAGAIRLRGSEKLALPPEVRARILASLSHRGPDARGDWVSPDGRCWLGHTRLAIVDLSDAGRQPMGNEDGSLQVVFNGEIYNHADLRPPLDAAGHAFRSHCDTEVLLHGYEAWGLAGLLGRLRGMFAFAIYDGRSGALALARDRLGIKPLYHTLTPDGILLFASEIKALLAHPAVRREVDPTALAQYLTFRYVPAPLTLFKNIYKLPGGHAVQLPGPSVASSSDVERSTSDVGRSDCPLPSRRYWDAKFDRAPARFPEALERTDALLEDAVRSHLMSDVPLGAQLSGGVDSSLIVAHMERLRRQGAYVEPVRTFSIGFDAEGYSELPYARMVADRYGTEHHEVTVGFADFLDHFAHLCWVHDEPVSEPASIPTYLLCRFARRHVTVMLTGEGGDELFAGYPKCAADPWARYVAWLPAGARGALLRGAARLLPFSGRRARIALENLAIADEAARLSAWFSAFDASALAGLLHGDFLRAHPGAVAAAPDRLREDLCRADAAGIRHPLERMLYADLHTWLVDDLLVKGDRMSMASGVEARVPFLDHPLVEYAATLPPEYKAAGRRTKILLKALAERYLPSEAIYRRKVGFTVPLTPWFLGPLRPFVRQTLLSDRALSRGYFDPAALRKLVDEHLGAKVDRSRPIWTLLALELWHRLFIDDDGSESAAARLQEFVRLSAEPAALT